MRRFLYHVPRVDRACREYAPERDPNQKPKTPLVASTDADAMSLVEMQKPPLLRETPHPCQAAPIFRSRTPKPEIFSNFAEKDKTKNGIDIKFSRRARWKILEVVVLNRLCRCMVMIVFVQREDL
jgi:hypothetical protein